MEYTQRENIINGLREAVGISGKSTEDTKTKMFNAGTGTLHILDKDINKNQADSAIRYFEELLTTAKLPEKTYYELALSAIKEQFK